MTTKTKLDVNDIVNKIRASFKNEKLGYKIGTGSNLKVLEEKDFIKLPNWWREPTQTFGIPFGRMTIIAGQPDSGKTSLAIQAIKAAVEQGCIVIYTETEGKTTEKDFLAWGVDPNQIIVVSSVIAEEAFELTFKAWEAAKDEYPETPLLVVFDSLGNVISQRDSDIDLTEQSSQPGGKGKINRIGLNKMIAKMSEDNAAVLLITYTYDLMGSPGKKNAGGDAMNFFSILTYQTARKKWLEKTVKGEKQRIGAEVIFKLYKNHINKENPGKKEIYFQITKEGMSYIGGKDDDDESESAG